MKKISLILIITLSMYFPGVLSGQSVQLYAELCNCTLESGEILSDCTIGYRTFGTLNQARSNGIIYPSWFGGTSEDMDDLIGPGELIDETEFFIIAIEWDSDNLYI